MVIIPNIKLERYTFISCSLFYVTFILLCVASYYLNIADESGLVEFRYDRYITIVSLVYFFALLIFSFSSEKHFWFVLPVVILTVPNAFNSIFPGFYLTHIGERGNATFSFISHIDIYFLSHILLIILREKKIQLSKDMSINSLYFIVFFLGLSLLYNCGELLFNGGDVLHVLNGAFHFRYTFLFLLVCVQLKKTENEQAFIHGLLISIPVLFLEGIVSTFLSGSDFFGSLQSGNFANNVFGNLLAFLFIFLWMLDSSKINYKLLLRICIFILFLSILMTGVRGALLSLFFGFIAYYFLIRISFISFFVSLLIAAIITYFMLVYFDHFYLFEYLLELYNSFILIIEHGYGTDGIKVDETNTSLITRFSLWIGTFDMGIQNWFFGVGSSQWNYLKSDYGINFNILLDPHNDYLNFFALYGFGGLLFIYILYIKPVFYVFFSKLTDNFNIYKISFFVLSVSALTNANNSKHQVFALIIIFYVLSLWYEKEKYTRNFKSVKLV